MNRKEWNRTMEFSLNEILTIIDKVKDTGLASFSYEDMDTKIKVKGNEFCKPDKKKEKQTVSDLEMKTDDMEPNYVIIESPMVGTFYAAPSEDGEPFVKTGDVIETGQTVGIVEAMKLMNEIEAEVSGTVVEILVTNEQMIEFGQPLMKILPKA